MEHGFGNANHVVSSLPDVKREMWQLPLSKAVQPAAVWHVKWVELP